MYKYLFLMFLFLGCGTQKTITVPVTTNSCSTEETDRGVYIICNDKKTFIENGTNGKDGASGKDGQDGSDGQDGADGLDGSDGIVDIVDPCGDDPSEVDEVLIRTSTDKVVAWYLDLGLAVLEPGTYQTTDDQSCVFTVNSDKTITDTFTLQASRERPSGAFIDQNLNDLISFTIPSTMQIVNISGPLSHSGQQWAHIETETTKYCYQMTGVKSKTLSYRFSIPETDSCSASAGLPNDGLSGTVVSTTSLNLRMNNSVKQSGNHVTTTIQTTVEVTR